MMLKFCPAGATPSDRLSNANRAYTREGIYRAAGASRHSAHLDTQAEIQGGSASGFSSGCGPKRS